MTPDFSLEQERIIQQNAREIARLRAECDRLAVFEEGSRFQTQIIREVRYVAGVPDGVDVVEAVERLRALAGDLVALIEEMRDYYPYKIDGDSGVLARARTLGIEEANSGKNSVE